MSRVPSPTDFQVSVDGIGTFTFARRRMRDEMAIGAELSRLTEGVTTPTAFLALVAGWISTIKVLTVEAPSGWNIDEMDPLDEDSYAKLAQVHAALRAKEESFRGGSKLASEAERKGDSPDT
jgi:hypothetical protein